jgi:hypothetical protein
MRFWRPKSWWKTPFPFFRLLMEPFVSIIVEEPVSYKENGYPFSVRLSFLAGRPWLRLRLWYWQISIIADILRGIGFRNRWYWRWWRTSPEGWFTMGQWEESRKR